METLKILNYIRNKKELQELYLSQMSDEYIRNEINEILRETRMSIPAGMRMNAKNITTREAIIFIEQNGTPDGYTLSDELKTKLKEYREFLENKKRTLKIEKSDGATTS
jgi:DNA-directed RNA polymerase specialized sigma subunit